MNRVIILLLLVLLAHLHLSAQVEVVNLKCEYMKNPMGVDMSDPRFYWQLSSDVEGQFQKAYRIVVATSEELLQTDKGDMLDSGKKKSGQNTHIAYNGKALEPATSYFWKVKIWDRNGKEQEWSKAAKFTTGLFTVADWKGAEWISWRPQEEWARGVVEEDGWWKRSALSGACPVILGCG